MRCFPGKKWRSSGEGRLQPRMTGERGEGGKQSQEGRLENRGRPYKFPSWKSRLAPRDLGDRTEGNVETIKRWKNVQSGIGQAGKRNQTICSQAPGCWQSALSAKAWARVPVSPPDQAAGSRGGGQAQGPQQDSHLGEFWEHGALRRGRLPRSSC